MKEIIKHYCDSLITFCAALVMGGQYYLENIVGLEPCNLCLLQKYSVQAVFLIFLIKMVVPKFKIIFNFLGIFALCFGASASVRQYTFKTFQQTSFLVGIVIFHLSFYLICTHSLKLLVRSFKVAANVRKSHGPFLG